MKVNNKVEIRTLNDLFILRRLHEVAVLRYINQKLQENLVSIVELSVNILMVIRNVIPEKEVVK